MHAAIPGFTPEQQAILAAPLAIEAHYFLNGLVYLKENEIKERLTMVDLSWEWSVLNPDRNDAKERAATVTGHLTVCGITRGGMGMAEALTGKSDAEKEVNEPEKSAATDAFKRAARMHWVGDYLLKAPKNMKDHAALQAWINSRIEEERADWPPQKFVALCLRDHGLTFSEIAPALEASGESSWKTLSYKQKYALLGKSVRVAV